MKGLLGLFTQYRGLKKEIYILFFGRVVTNLGSMVWPMLTMILNRKLGLGAFTISAVMVGAMLFLMPAHLLGGRMADRLNKKMVIVWCDIVSIVCYIVCSAIPLSYVSVGLMLVAAIFQNMEHPSYSALVADLTATKDRERAYSLQYLGANLGLVLSPTIAGLLFKDFLWLSFLISGLAIACSTVLIFFRVKDITPVEDKGEEAVYQRAQTGTSIFSILKKNRIIVIYLVAAALYSAAYQQYHYLMPFDMGKVHGENGAVIFGTVSSLNCIAVVVFTPIITQVFRRVMEPKKFLIGVLLLAAGYVMFLLMLGIIPAYYGAMLLFTWGEVFDTIAAGSYLSKRVPASHRGRVNGVASVLGLVIQAVFALVIGRLYDHVGRTSAWSMVLSLLGVAAALMTVLILRDKKAYPRLYGRLGWLTPPDNADIPAPDPAEQTVEK